MRIPLAGLAVLLLLSPASAAAPRTFEVVIDQMKFGAMPASVRPGDRIIWVNRDLFRHTATAKAAGFDVDLPPGAKRVSTVIRSGTFTVTCRYHPGMRTTLKVAAK